MAIVPYQPCLHATLIAIWAAAQPEEIREFFADQGQVVQNSSDFLTVGTSHDDEMNTQMDSQGAEQDDMIIVDVVAETQGVSQVSIGSDVEMEGQVPAKKCLTPMLICLFPQDHRRKLSGSQQSSPPNKTMYHLQLPQSEEAQGCAKRVASNTYSSVLRRERGTIGSRVPPIP